MDLKLTGKTAVVTGGTAGIGLAIAIELAREGAQVVVPGRTREKLDNAVRSIGGDSARGIAADVATASGAQTLLSAVPETDILVNNLGTYEPKSFTEITDEDWQRLFEANVLSGIRLSRQYFKGMLSRNWGRIIFISSESAIQTPPEMIHYGMTKSAQLAISRGLAELTRGTNVTVNAVMPGPTRSEGIVGFLKSMSSNPAATPAEAEREFFEKHRSASLLQRLIDPAEIASLVAYLASPLAAATNGAALRVEGGLLRSIA
jgi:NAD(P)-dependent dehydrogenase (short-subunit alcohol dehydrogenase family)